MIVTIFFDIQLYNIVYLITFLPNIAIIHYGIYYNSYENQTINNHADHK